MSSRNEGGDGQQSFSLNTYSYDLEGVGSFSGATDRQSLGTASPCEPGKRRACFENSGLQWLTLAANQSLKRTKPEKKANPCGVDAGGETRHRTSPAWKFFAKFDPAQPGAHNIRCIVDVKHPDGTIRPCTWTGLHVPNKGTKGMFVHLKKHPKELAMIRRSSCRSTEATEARATFSGWEYPLAKSRPTTAMSPEVREQFLRRIVMWCAMDGRSLSTVHGFAFKMLIGFLNPAAVAPMPSPASLTSTLDSMYQEAKARVIHKLKGRCDAFSVLGYREAFCSLRIDMATVAKTEYITISTSFISHDSGDLEMLTLLTRAFCGAHQEDDVVRVIEEVTTEYFNFVPDVQPRDVFVAATVDRGGNVMNACKSLGLPTLVCRAHRLNSCVLWALGIAGSQRRCKHPSMRKLLGKLAALVRIFLHSAVDNDALRKECNEQEQGALVELQAAAEQEREAEDDVDEGGEDETFTTTLSRDEKQERGILNPTRRYDIRWESQFDCMSRAIILEDTIARYLQRHPENAGRGLSPYEWSIIKEVCSILDPLKFVNAAVQGGRGGRLSQSIFLCHELLEVLKLDSLDMIDWKTFRDPRNATAESTSERLISSLASESCKVRDVAFTEIEERGLAAADLDVEVIALYLDPRYSKLDKSFCANGDNDGGRVKRAREELFRIAAKMSLEGGRASSPQIASGDSGTTAGCPKALTIFERRQIKREKEAQARALKVSIKDRMENEMADYERHPAVVSREFDLLLWWRDAAMPKLDANGNIADQARFPLLACMANIFHCIHSTSCRSERDLSALTLSLTNMRQSSLPEEVQKIMFLRMNPLLFPDIAERQKVEAVGHAYAKATQAI